MTGAAASLIRSIDGGPAIPPGRKVSASQSGVGGAPTLLSNAETFAQLADRRPHRPGALRQHRPVRRAGHRHAHGLRRGRPPDGDRGPDRRAAALRPAAGRRPAGPAGRADRRLPRQVDRRGDGQRGDRLPQLPGRGGRCAGRRRDPADQPGDLPAGRVAAGGAVAGGGERGPVRPLLPRSARPPRAAWRTSSTAAARPPWRRSSRSPRT